ncbi:MAG: tRNA (5-methylaminomethyl-2-thiouridine)(34)-methyltransferase MnmD [Chitinophagaceae bacterium]|nr:tRNA (5-methylaminomethyl-2-thiouridine)(34)-methyltransferase MnmD [Chitinophagaceae bacterium]
MRKLDVKVNKTKVAFSRQQEEDVFLDFGNLHDSTIFNRIKMERLKKITADGSHTLYEPTWGVTYHSVYGAIQESLHVFINAGLHYRINHQKDATALHILEVGFGTGLNALLSLQAIENKQLTIHYHATEPFPLKEQEFSGLNYHTVLLCPDLALPFAGMHAHNSREPVPISPRFILYRYRETIQEFRSQSLFDLVYFDAFAPDIQPELWTSALFKHIYGMMAVNGVLVTYCSKGTVRRAMTEAGFQVEKIPGPAHKREIIRAVKDITR